jgi:hypothetical protein
VVLLLVVVVVVMVVDSVGKLLRWNRKRSCAETIGRRPHWFEWLLLPLVWLLLLWLRLLCLLTNLALLLWPLADLALLLRAQC